MKAYVSMHTAAPQSQIDSEVIYNGYRRIAVDYGDDFGSNPVKVQFPIIEEDSPDKVIYAAVGAAEKGQGEIFMRVPIFPHIPLLIQTERKTREFWLENGIAPENVDKMIEDYGYTAPIICIANSNPIRLPENLNPIARVAHKLIYSGLMKAEELHPKLYEAINDALHNAGVPIIPVIRSGAANMQFHSDYLKNGNIH